MNLELKKELPIIGIVLTPFVYLAIIWDSLPQRVPIHWNYKGEIDNWGSKSFLVVLVFILPVLMYGVMFAAAKLDPKNRISLMGKKFYKLKFFFGVVYVFTSRISFIYLKKSVRFESKFNVHFSRSFVNGNGELF